MPGGPEAAGDALRDEARRLATEAADAPVDTTRLAPRDAAGWVALAWALKDETQAAWSEAPARAPRCAAWTAALAGSAATLPHPAQAEIAAAAAWADGLAQLAQGHVEVALERLGRAQAALRALGQPLRAAQAQVPALVALSMLGRHDDAVALGERTRAELAAAGDELGAGKVELNLGSMLMRRDRHAAALPLFRQASVRFARAGDATHSIMADIGQASALTWHFEFDEALRLYDRATERARSRGLTPLLGAIDTNRGRLELQRGRLHAALPSLEAALREAQADGMPHDVADAQRDLADAYLALNLLPEAVALYDRTLASCDALDMPTERAWAGLQRAEAVARLGDRAEAAAALARARAGFAADDNAIGLALVALRQAALAQRDGQAATALQQAQAAAQALEDAGVEAWRAEAELVAAAALADLGRDAEAEACLGRVLAAPGAALHAQAHTGLGELQARRGDRAAARRRFESAVRAVELQRALLPGDEFRTAWGADKQHPYEALIALALDAAGAAGEGAATWAVLQAAEQARAPALLTALARRDEGGADDPAQRQRWRWLHGQWQQALAAGERERAAALQARVHALEQEALEAARRHHAAAAAAPAGPAGDGTPPMPEDEAALRARLPPDTALVVYVAAAGRWAACVATRERLAHVTLDVGDLFDRLERLRFQLDAPRFAAAPLRAHAAQMVARCQAHLRALHTLLLAPLAPLVDGRTRVVVVPHGALHYVPFAALHDGTAALVERHELVLAPGAALWATGRSDVGRGDSPPLRRAAVLGAGSDALPHVVREVRAVADAFRRRPGGDAVVHLDADATRDALRRALAGADVLHLACHGQFRADSPYLSALHLGDGPLTLRDAAELPLAARLVTLSACETGLSRVAPGDEQLGLLRGFLIAGARRVLSTLWTVDDAATATLMTGFYDAVLGGLAPAAALRRAQRALAAEHPHPYLWAAFALHERG